MTKRKKTEGESSLSARKRTPKVPQTIDGKTGVIDPAPQLRMASLKGIQGVKREMGRIYKAMRTGKIDPAVGTKLTYTLAELCKVIQVADFEDRIASIEREIQGTLRR